MSIQPAHEIGDRPWVMINGEPRQIEVVGRNFVCNAHEARDVYILRHGSAILELSPDLLHPTKEELLKQKENETIHHTRTDRQAD